MYFEDGKILKLPIHFDIPTGDITVYKKVNSKIITLLIPSEAKRVHAIGYRKCRAEFAKVLEIEGGLQEITNNAYAECKYIVGEIVRPDSFTESDTIECGHGINFFLNKTEAVRY